jgi:hypothetical protein
VIVVHHLNDPRSQRIPWLLEELGVPYEIRHDRRDPATMRAPRELYEVHPLGKSPVITDGDVTVAEPGRSSNTCSRPSATAGSCHRPVPRPAAGAPTGCITPRAQRSCRW